jgi:hypothetical protein
MDLKSLGRCIKHILLVKVIMESPLPEEMEEFLEVLVEAYKAMQLVEVPESAIIRNHFFRTFDDVQEDICYNRYRFLKQDLWRVHRALRLDQLGPCIICTTVSMS